MHGLRHVFASRLASSGKVDLYRIQKLLTHKSPQMTQRYAHLSNEVLREASEVMDNIGNDYWNYHDNKKVDDMYLFDQ